ncbi:MSMEG_0565 family glycosyltransferase [Sphingomonas sp. H39-1-10]|uniref:MSMEG_0565 family glycosyltransferase n=1 Tax=Sphingomonas pollutisoli TaxID=3030829 RepID=UPI0023B8D235|nr:MSMEG_0565 family glycosyltransferase [Sphingomonas pollutisoli]MDF0490067.1 MSMEG_0565 family glycosyltransferase [Sphingomonas pollutisoli]
MDQHLMSSQPSSPAAHSPRVALTTYSTKPRGGVVHTLELAEALQAQGVDVTVIAMGERGSLFREVTVPVEYIRPPEVKDTLEARVFSWIDTLTKGLEPLRERFDIVHSQDCISARAAARIRDAGAAFRLVRTVHHVDDFTTDALIECQRQAILEPDDVLVVSKVWQERLHADYGVEADIVTNGVWPENFRCSLDDTRRKELRRRVGAEDRFLYLTIGGIEPRKGSRFLAEALSRLKSRRAISPVLAIIGGHSFQDYSAYSEEVLASLPGLGLELGRDVVLLRTVAQAELVEWLAVADGFVFPSINEGWGLVIMEAASAGLPVVASDIDVFREFLDDGQNAILTRAGDSGSLALGMARLMDEPNTRRRLAAEGTALVANYGWDRTARQHIAQYDRIWSAMNAAERVGLSA